LGILRKEEVREARPKSAAEDDKAACLAPFRLLIVALKAKEEKVFLAFDAHIELLSYLKSLKKLLWHKV